MGDICDLCNCPADPSTEECWRVDCRIHCSSSGTGDVYHEECLQRFIKAETGLQYINRQRGSKTATHGEKWPCPRGKGKGPGQPCNSWVQTATIIIKKKPKAPKPLPAAPAAAPRNKQQPGEAKAAPSHPAAAKAAKPAAGHWQQQQPPVARRPPLPAAPKPDPLGRKLPAGGSGESQQQQEERSLPPGYDPDAAVPGNKNARKRAKAAAAKAAAATAAAGVSSGADRLAGVTSSSQAAGAVPAAPPTFVIHEQHRALMGGGKFITRPEDLLALLGPMALSSDDDEEDYHDGGDSDEEEEEEELAVAEQEEEQQEEEQQQQQRPLEEQQQQEEEEDCVTGFEALCPRPPGYNLSQQQEEQIRADYEAFKKQYKRQQPQQALGVHAGSWDPSAAAGLPGPDTPAARESHTAAPAPAAGGREQPFEVVPGALALRPPPTGFPQAAAAVGTVPSPLSLPLNQLPHPHVGPPAACSTMRAALDTPPTPMQVPVGPPGFGRFSSGSISGSWQAVQQQQSMAGPPVQQTGGVADAAAALPTLPFLPWANQQQNHHQQAAQADVAAVAAAGVAAWTGYGGGGQPAAALLPAVPTAGAHKHLYAHHSSGGDGSRGLGDGVQVGAMGPAASHQGPEGEEDEESEALVEELMLMLT